MTTKKQEIKQDHMPLISKTVIEVRYDLNWFYMREKILSYKNLPTFFKSLWFKYCDEWNKKVNKNG